MTEGRIKTLHGAILYDAELIPRVSDGAFSAGTWESSAPVTGTFKSAGRGNTMIVSDGRNEFVLRRYLRGGLAGLLIRDHYLWLGEHANRAFAEFRLLAKLHARGLPVPVPAAARYRRHGILYTADLITVRVPGIRSLSDRLTAADGNAEFWRNLGAGIFRFHDAGVFHADLNVSNVQLDENDGLCLLDFDRGKVLPAGPWRQRNLARFHRSLRKVKKFNPSIHYTERNWNQFLKGYFDASRSA
ncbi:MAG: 3-deoxy-D-manno-octulosonic acid kinase [Gammaproteobacteria bacterium]|nr:3-deoxy-D-manno-octulosonic acid kinase [Gammaproteobacteria bacterium]